MNNFEQNSDNIQKDLINKLSITSNNLVFLENTLNKASIQFEKILKTISFLKNIIFLFMVLILLLLVGCFIIIFLFN